MHLSGLRKKLGFAWLLMAFVICLWAQFQARPYKSGGQLGLFAERLAVVAKGSLELPISIREVFNSAAKALENDPMHLAILDGKPLRGEQLKDLSPGYRLLTRSASEVSESEEFVQARSRIYLCLALLAVILSLALSLPLIGRCSLQNSLRPMSKWGVGEVLALFMGWHVFSMLALAPVVQTLFLKCGLSSLTSVVAYQLTNYGLMLFVLQKIKPACWNLNFPCSFVFTGLGYFMCYALVYSCNAVLMQLVDGELSSNNPLLDLFSAAGTLGILALASLVILIGPMFEEIVFRGWLFAGLREHTGNGRAIVISAGLFSLVHADLMATPALFALGCIFAWVALRAGSLWPSILLHALWNASSFVFVLANLP